MPSRLPMSVQSAASTAAANRIARHITHAAVSRCDFTKESSHVSCPVEPFAVIRSLTSRGCGQRMISMLRALVLTTLVFALPHVAAGQTLSVLHIKVLLVDPERGATPVPRQRLLISDNPATAAPRLIVTGTDGTADVKLRPGNYTVESDRATAFRGKAYQWTQIVDVVAGRDAVLELTADNAEVATASAAIDSTSSDAPPLEADPSFLLTQWQNSVVALWTPTAHASGFVIDAKGLIATNQKRIGSASAVEVRVTGSVKVQARVLAGDPTKDVAVLWVDPTVVATARPMSLGSPPPTTRAVTAGTKIFTITSPL